MADGRVDPPETALIVGQGGGLEVQLAVFLHVPGREVRKADAAAVGAAGGRHLFLKLDHLPGQFLLYLPGRQLGVGRPDRPAAYLPPVHPDAGCHRDAVALAPFFNGRHKNTSFWV